MARVLKAAGVQVFTWREGDLPGVQQVRNALAALIAPPAEAPAKAITAPRAVPLIPVAEIEEILADGDRAAEEMEPNLEPVPSAFFDDLEPAAPHR
jgi:hypothetical protein